MVCIQTSLNHHVLPENDLFPRLAIYPDTFIVFVNSEEKICTIFSKNLEKKFVTSEAAVTLPQMVSRKHDLI